MSYWRLTFECCYHFIVKKSQEDNAELNCLMYNKDNKYLSFPAERKFQTWYWSLTYYTFTFHSKDHGCPPPQKYPLGWVISVSSLSPQIRNRRSNKRKKCKTKLTITEDQNTKYTIFECLSCWCCAQVWTQSQNQNRTCRTMLLLDPMDPLNICFLTS